MIAWEYLKKDFGYNMENPNIAELGPLFLSLQDSQYFDSDEHAVRLSQ